MTGPAVLLESWLPFEAIGEGASGSSTIASSLTPPPNKDLP